MRQWLVLSIIFICVAAKAHAFEFQVGAEYAALSPTKETAGTTAPAAFVAFGPELWEGASVLVEAMYTGYSAKKPADNNSNPNSVTESGTLDVTGIGYALILQQRVRSAAFRLGGGVIEYSFKDSFDSDANAIFQRVGGTNVTEKFNNAEGTQALFGIDTALTDHLYAGIEYRSVVLHSNVDFGGTFPGFGTVSNTRPANLSHTWTAVRLLLDF